MPCASCNLLREYRILGQLANIRSYEKALGGSCSPISYLFQTGGEEKERTQDYMGGRGGALSSRCAGEPHPHHVMSEGKGRRRRRRKRTRGEEPEPSKKPNRIQGNLLSRKTSHTAESQKQDPENRWGWAVTGSQNHQDNKQIRRSILFRLASRAKGDPLSRCFGGIAFPLVKVELP